MFALTLLLISLMVMMTLSFGTKMKEKIELQQVADQAAYSNAVVVARGFNSLALLNRVQIAHMVAIGGIQAAVSYAASYRGLLDGAEKALMLSQGNHGLKCRSSIGIIHPDFEAAKQLPKAQKEAEAHPRGHQPAQQAPRQPLVPGARHGGLDGGAADIDQPAIAHARGAGRLAGAAGQTAVQVELGLAAGGLALQDLLDQIDAAPGSVQFIAQELVGGTSGGAETAVHTGSQDGIRLLALVTVANESGQLGLHTYKSR